MIVFLILVPSRCLVPYALLLLFKLIDINWISGQENVFTWGISKVLKVIFCLTYLIKKFSSLEMLYFLNIFSPINQLYHLNLSQNLHIPFLHSLYLMIVFLIIIITIINIIHSHLIRQMIHPTFLLHPHHHS